MRPRLSKRNLATADAYETVLRFVEDEPDLAPQHRAGVARPHTTGKGLQSALQWKIVEYTPLAGDD